MIKIAVILTLLSSVSMCTAGDQVLNRKLKRGDRRICSILVLPAEVTVTMYGFHGGQGLWEKNDEFEDALGPVVVEALAGRGAKIRQAEPASSEEERTALVSLQRRFDAIYPQLLRSFGAVRNGRFTIGDAAAGYLPASSADTLLFIRGKGARPASKAAALSFRRLGYELNLTFVDARSGEALAWIDFTGAGAGRNPPQKDIPNIREVLDNLFLGEPPTLAHVLGPGPRGGGCPSR